MRLLPLAFFSATALAAPPAIHSLGQAARHSLAAAASPRSARLVRSADFHPNPNFKPIHKFDAGAMQAGRVEQVGEVVILEGDDKIVSTSQNGWGVVFDSRAQNPLDIANRFYTAYNDEFDEIVIFTTFDDQGAAGAAAYEISAQQDIKGIGQDQFDESSSWGSKDGKLHAFVNMMKWDQFAYPGSPITDPNNYLYPVLGQEFAHRWLSFMHYIDQDGNNSAAMLGRDQAHWASTMQADGSVMDGNNLTLASDGYYDATEFMTRYSTLDLYGMGLIPSSAVQPWFLLHNAVTNKGRAVDPTQYLPTGARLKGTREDITIDQVLAAEGPRTPAWDQSAHAFRIAFVLVTHPGERAGDVLDIARTLDKVRTVWEQQFKLFTNGSGTVCTQVSAPCGAIAAAHVEGGDVVENGGNRNGVVEPGEPVLMTVHLDNDSRLPARNVAVASSDALANTTPVMLEQLPPQTRRDVVFMGTLPADAVCGDSYTIDVTSTVDGHVYRGFADVTPGLTQALHVSFAESRAGWIANPDGKDSTTFNGWAWGTPRLYHSLRSSWIFQPEGCHEASKCWFTGLQAGHSGMEDSSLGVGESHLWSKPIDLSKTYQPVLKAWVWFQAIDYSNPMLGGQEASGVSLLLEGSIDHGKSWVTLDTISTILPSWQERTVPLDGLVDTSGTLILRFTAANPVATTVVEAGVGDLTLTTLTPACNPEMASGMLPQTPSAGGGCDVGGRAPAAGAAALFLFALALLLRRRLA